jgi:hypothetical protein
MDMSYTQDVYMSHGTEYDMISDLLEWKYAIQFSNE